MHADTTKYNDSQPPADREIFELLALEIDPIFRRRKTRYGMRIRYGFWTASYRRIQQAERLRAPAVLEWAVLLREGTEREGTFKAAEVRYTTAGQGARDVMRSPPACLRNSRSAPHAASTSRPSRCFPCTSSSGT